MPSQLQGRVLLVSDPNQGRQAEALIRRHLPHVLLVPAIWERGTPKDPVRRIIRKNGPYEATFSFNNDLVLEEEDLATVGEVTIGMNGSSHQIRPAYNFHPSLIPGMGYGTTPLYEDMPSHGALAHLLIRKVDAGPIFDVLEVPLPADTDFRQLRLRNQLLALALFDRFLQRLTKHTNWTSAHQEIGEMADRLQRPWSPRVVTIAERDEALQRLYAENPGHRVFRGMPMNDGVLLNGTPENVVVLPDDFSNIDALLRRYAA